MNPRTLNQSGTRITLEESFVKEETRKEDSSGEKRLNKENW
jgi:hypothetical protein